MEQQQPTTLSADDLLSNMFADSTGEKLQEQQLPTPPQSTIPDTTQVIVDTPIVETKEEEKKEVVKTNSANKLQTLLDTGFLENVSITYNDEEVFLSDISDIDEDTLKEVIEQYKAEKDSKLKENYISKEGLDETTQKLIEIKKAGGDITEIVRENVQAIDQLSNLKLTLDEGDDAEKEQLSINILAQDLRQKGLEDEVIEAQLRAYINKGELEDRATKILDSHLALHQQEIENKKQQELDRVAKEKEEAKTFRKNLSQTYKDLAIPENIQKVLVENATKTDEYQISNTDKLYFESRKNPELFAKVNFFLNNPEKFEEWISGKKVVKAKAQEILKSSITINTSKTKPIETKNTVDATLDSMFQISNK